MKQNVIFHCHANDQHPNASVSLKIKSYKESEVKMWREREREKLIFSDIKNRRAGNPRTSKITLKRLKKKSLTFFQKC